MYICYTFWIKKKSNVMIYIPYIMFRIVDNVSAVGNFMRLLEPVFVNDMNNLPMILCVWSCCWQKKAIDDELWKNLTSEITSLPLEVLLPNYQEADTKINLTMSEPHWVNFIFAVWLFDIWNPFDSLIFWHMAYYFSHLSPLQGYFYVWTCNFILVP